MGVALLFHDFTGTRRSRRGTGPARTQNRCSVASRPTTTGARPRQRKAGRKQRPSGRSHRHAGPARRTLGGSSGRRTEVGGVLPNGVGEGGATRPPIAGRTRPATPAPDVSEPISRRSAGQPRASASAAMPSKTRNGSSGSPGSEPSDPPRSRGHRDQGGADGHAGVQAGRQQVGMNSQSMTIRRPSGSRSTLRQTQGEHSGAGGHDDPQPPWPQTAKQTHRQHTRLRPPQPDARGRGRGRQRRPRVGRRRQAPGRAGLGQHGEPRRDQHQRASKAFTR